jgi:antitoxin component YwqK of YwqJK toxin-antitoxin module
MRKFFLPIIFLLTIISCGKKREVIYDERDGGPHSDFAPALYIENDSAFHTRRYLKNGKIVEMQKAASLQELEDSTYCRIYYYHESGNVYSIDYFQKKKHVGESLSFYESGKKKSRATFSDGIRGNYEIWYESGKLMIEGELLPDSTFRHREYFESGLPKKEMATDKTGKGQCTYYYTNGKTKETGPMVDFNPCGIWKIYDTLGNLKHDTVFGLK